MKQFKTYEEFVNETTSGEIFNPKRGKETKFDHTKHPELASEFYDLIQTAYAEIGGHVKIKTPNDIFSDPDWNWWAGADLHGTKDFDILMFGQKTKFGVKFSGVGHDGTSDAKRFYIDARGRDLQKPGFYIEVSGKIAEILINKYGVPVVNDQAEVEKVLGRKVEWNGSNNPEDKNASGDGWYTRVLGGHPHAKILLGRPKV